MRKIVLPKKETKAVICITRISPELKKQFEQALVVAEKKDPKAVVTQTGVIETLIKAFIKQNQGDKNVRS